MANAAVRNARQRKAAELQQEIENRKAKSEQQEEMGSQPQEEPANPESNVAPDQPPVDERYERLQGKARSLEKDNAQIRKDLEEAKRQISELANPPAPQKTQAELDKEFEDNLREEVGADTWDYMDDASKKAIIAVAKRSSGKPDNIDEKINDVLRQRDEQDSSRAFVKQLDNMLTPHGVTFIQLANNDEFEQWINASRRRLAVFEDAMQHRDAEALKDVEYLVKEFYRGPDSPPDSSAPSVKPSVKQPQAKIQEVTYDQYLQALRDKRHPSRRDNARKIIAQFKEQQEK